MTKREKIEQAITNFVKVGDNSDTVLMNYPEAEPRGIALLKRQP
jgi:hypothetical protein